MCGTDTDCGCQDTSTPEISTEKRMKFLTSIYPDLAQRFASEPKVPKAEARANAIQRRISGYRSKNSA